MYTSTNGQTWTLATGIPGNATGKVFSISCNKIECNGKIFVAVGHDVNNTNIAWSIDGDVWQYADAPMVFDNCYTVAWDGIIWIASYYDSFNGTSYIINSKEGQIWYDINYVPTAGDYINTIVSAKILPNLGSNDFVLVGGGDQANKLTYSLHGTDFININYPNTLSSVILNDPLQGGNDGIWNIAYNGSYWLMTTGVGSRILILRSANGVMWTPSNFNGTGLNPNVVNIRGGGGGGGGGASDVLVWLNAGCN